MALKYDPRSGEFRDYPDNPVIKLLTCNGGSTCYTNEDITLKWEIEDVKHLYLNGEEINADSISHSLRFSECGEQTVELVGESDGIRVCKTITLHIINAPCFRVTCKKFGAENSAYLVNWNVEYASSAFLVNNGQRESIPLTGSMELYPQTTTSLYFEAIGLYQSKKFIYEQKIEVFNQFSGKNYTKKQLDVINARKGYNMVLAGPGCGKTDILAERIARAYERGDANLEDMLCLTFTNRAARGMFERIKERLGSDSTDLFVGNIHRYCSHFLFDQTVVSVESSILDEEDALEVLTSEVSDEDLKLLIDYHEKEIYNKTLVSVDWDVVNDLLGIDYHPSGSTGLIQESTAKKIINAARMKIMDMQHLMMQAQKGHPQSDLYHKEMLESFVLKDSLPFYADFESASKTTKYDVRTFPTLDAVDKLLSLSAKYNDYKVNNNLLDFDDLLILTYDTYYNDHDYKYKRYKWVQIDEIQDLSNFQLSLVDLLTDKREDFVVLYLGDEQQAIYSFMGASLDSLNQLKNRCLNHIFRLDKNFRSPKYLLDIYNEYAIKELNVDKVFLPEPKDDKKAGLYDVCLHAYDSLNEETDHVYDAVLPYLRNEGHKNERTALLVPWNSDANEISDRLKKDKIPHFKISGLDSFQTVHMRTLMAHFNAVANDFNLIAWSRILKQTYAVDSYAEGRHLIEDMRKYAMCPSDLLRTNGTYLSDFVRCFDNKEIVLYDTETTGVDVFNDDIVQIAAVKLINGLIVPGSSFNIFLQTEKHIPEKLGKNINPMVEAYKIADKLPREEGLKKFMDYVGDSILMGHNVNYDYNILKYNLKRYCGSSYSNYRAQIIDTLKLAHLICPRFRKYKLEYLIERLGLQGVNSHMADDDIMATYELAKYCRDKADLYLHNQHVFLSENKTKQIKDELSFGYKDCYERTKDRLYTLRGKQEEYAIITEMKESSEALLSICEIRPVASFDSILAFLGEDVVSSEEPNALSAHFSKHLMDMSTYREADLCSSSSFKEKLFVSTVHKAKGLEFENVIVMRAVSGRYPHFAHTTMNKQEEDKRLFYVAISRAMKRLVVSGGLNATITPYMHNILHHFCLRFILYENNGTRILVEIWNNRIRIKYYQNKVLKYTKDYNDIESVYSLNGISNQFDLMHIIQCYCKGSDVFESVDRILRERGVVPTYN